MATHQLRACAALAVVLAVFEAGAVCPVSVLCCIAWQQPALSGSCQRRMMAGDSAGRSKCQPGLASSQGQTTRSPMSVPMQHGRDVLCMTRQAPAGMCTAMTACPVGCQPFGAI